MSPTHLLKSPRCWGSKENLWHTAHRLPPFPEVTLSPHLAVSGAVLVVAVTRWVEAEML